MTKNALKLEKEQEEDVVTVNYNIASYPSDFTLSVICDMYTKGKIVIPDYQRGFVWTKKQASLLVESFLRGLPVPPVFFYTAEDNKSLVIDGQQRIKSVVFYFSGRFGDPIDSKKPGTFRLTGLADDNQYHNKSFEELDDSAQRKFENAVLRAMNILQLNPAGEGTSAYHIFSRLNTGGTPLWPQEIRNCVYQGALNNALKIANENASWRKILGTKNPDKHQTDVELLLRVFALFAAGSRYKKPMNDFLSKIMEEHRNGQTPEADRFFKVFAKAAEKMSLAGGEKKPFHLQKGHLNGSTLDSVMSVLVKNAQRLDRIDIKTRYQKLLADKVFRQSTQEKTTDTKAVSNRIKRAEEILLG